MAFGKPKEPKEPKEPKAKKVKAPKEKKPKAPKEKKPKPAPGEKKPKKPRKVRPPKGKKGKGAPEEVEGLEGEEQEGKKKIPLPLLIISLVVIVAAAVIVFLFVIRPMLSNAEDPDSMASAEPEPPELPEKIPIGDDVEIVGMTLEADESEAVAVKSKRVTYSYTNLVDAGKAAETYVGQLAAETPAFSIVDEELVRQTDKPDYTTAEGMVLLARNVPVPAPEETPAPETQAPESEDPDASAEPTPEPTPEPEPEPTPEPITYVHTVRITWSPGLCVVTVDEEEGQVTSPPRPSTAAPHSVTQRGAREILESMDPAELGLPGASMNEYEVLPMDGTEMVDDKVAIRMHVYNDKNAAGSNDFMGSFLMTIDGEHLYRVDPITDEITELDYTPR